MAYFRRLHFLLILEKVLTFISDELDVFRMFSRYDNIRACIAPYNSKRQFGYSMGTEIQEVLGAVWAAILYLALVKCQGKILVTLYSTLWTIRKSQRGFSALPTCR